MIDVGFFYVDIGRPWWRAAVDSMIESARATQPGCTVRHYSDQYTKQWPTADDSLLSADRIDPTNLMVAKGFMWAQAGLKAERNTVLTDADVQFRRDMEPLFDGDWDVGLLWRETGSASLAQPYLACMALTKPTPGARAFWQLYCDALGNLPKAWRAWWVDQVAFSVVLGICHHKNEAIKTDKFHVKLFDADLIAPKHETPDAYTWHYKGRSEEKKVA